MAADNETGQKLIIGFDCGIKTLGVCVCESLPYVDRKSNGQNFHGISARNMSRELAGLIRELEKENQPDLKNIRIIYIDVVNLLPEMRTKSGGSQVMGQNQKRILFCSRLKHYLDTLDQFLESHLHSTGKEGNIEILIEYQMEQTVIQDFILYHYSGTSLGYKTARGGTTSKTSKDNSGPERHVHIINPRLKNSIDLDEEKPYAYFLKKYSRTYTANKRHSEHNMSVFLQNQDYISVENRRIIASCKKKDDVADALMMCIGWIDRVGKHLL